MSSVAFANTIEQVPSGFNLIVKNTFIDVDDDTPDKIVPLKKAVTAPPAWREEQDSIFTRISDLSTTAPSSTDGDGDEDQPSRVTSQDSVPGNPLGWELRQQAFSQSAAAGPAVYGQWQPMYGQWQLPHARDAQWQPIWAMGQGGQFEIAEKACLPQDQDHKHADTDRTGEEVCHRSRCQTSEATVSNDSSSVADGFSRADGDWEVIEKASPFKPQTLSRWRNSTTGATRIIWTVDGKKLRGNDRMTVSPGFLLSGVTETSSLPFKMVITAQGGSSFRKTLGKGVVQLKCEGPREGQKDVTFSLSVASGHHVDSRLQPRRGPVTHNFGQSGICGLPKKREVWDFSQVLHEKSQSFVVVLEVACDDAPSAQ